MLYQRDGSPLIQEMVGDHVRRAAKRAGVAVSGALAFARVKWRGGRDSTACLTQREALRRLTRGPDARAIERAKRSEIGGVDGTRTRGLCRDRAAF